MNARDSHWLAAALESRGFCPAARQDAQVCILNTCSVREKPERKVADAIRRFQLEACGNSGRLVVVLGCVAQQHGRKFFEISPLARLVAGTDGIIQVPSEIERLLDHPEQKSCLVDFLPDYPEREKVRETNERGSAFVNIMQGCDNFCSYCIVPFTRGRQKSRNPDEILQECRAHIHAGAGEIVLLGQNVNAFGKDGGKMGFASLLRSIAELEGLKRLRYITPHPADMDDAAVRLFAELPVLCPRLHLPLQSGSDAILEKMRRRYDSGKYLELTRKLRNARPDIALSTDLIVGFPGETDADFESTLRLMRESGFMSSFSFCYSDRLGTRASRMTDKIPAPVMAARLQKLQALQDELSAEWLRARVGAEAVILLESPAAGNDGGEWLGKDEYGVTVHVRAEDGKPGDFCRARVCAAGKHSLQAEAV